MDALINGTLFHYFTVALAVASISVTITKSSLFKNFRNFFDLASLKNLFNCPYCLAHWLAMPSILLFGLIGVFAVIGLSAIFSLPILCFLEKLDGTPPKSRSL